MMFFGKMRVTRIIIVLGAFTLATIACSCNQTNTVVTNNSSNVSSLPSSTNEIDVTEVTILSAYISFSGPAGLPDGTVLLSQLDKDDKPLSWWPIDQPIKVENGKWQIKVSLGVNGAPSSLQSGPSYHFVVWCKDNATSKADHYFDLVGPPPP